MNDQRPTKHQQWHGRTFKIDACTHSNGLEKDCCQRNRGSRYRATTPMARHTTKGRKSLGKCKQFKGDHDDIMRREMKQ